MALRDARDYVPYWKSLKKSLKKLKPNIRIHRVEYHGGMGPQDYDHTKYPKGLEFWSVYYPTFILVPAYLWERAVEDSEVTMTIDDGAEGMNVVSAEDGTLRMVRGYNYDGKGVLAWATKTLR